MKKILFENIKHDLKPIRNTFLAAENGYRLDSAIKQFQNFASCYMYFISSLYPFSAFIINVCIYL